MTKVSIVIPNYNHAPFLGRRIDSVLDQTNDDFEIIYLDDGSTDDSHQVVEKYLSDGRIRVIRNTENSGCAFKQWNKGVRLARSEYVWIAEADDYADKRFLETLVRVLDENPKVGLAYCQSIRVDEDDRVVPAIEDFLRGEGRWANDFINDGRDECRYHLVSRNTIPNASAVLFRRSAYEEAGYADETMRLCGDWMMWVKLLLVSDIAFVVEPLNYYRTNMNSVRHRNRNRLTSYEEAYRVARYTLDHITVPTEILEQACQTLLGSWVNSIIQGRSLGPWRETRNIYRNAKKVDRRLRTRIIKNVASGISQSFLPPLFRDRLGSNQEFTKP